MPEALKEDTKHLSDEKGYKAWCAEIEDAMKREKTYRKLGRECVDLYEAKKPDETPFSILYSNTETLLPAVYNSRPIPIVTRRFKDADPVGKCVAEVSTRTLKYLIDCEDEDYDTFDELMPAAVLDGLVTNRGVTRFKFSPGKDGYAESVCGEAVRWDKFFHGYARTWKKVPWIGFEWDMTEEEVLQNFGAKINRMEFNFSDQSDESENARSETKEELTGVRTYKVYEIWNKEDRTVLFVSPCYKKGILRKVKDPLGLVSFYPIPKPLNFMRKITTLVPTPLYEHYKSQAKELNELTRRLKAIIRAVKYRGFYNSTIDAIEKMLEADDNTFIPVENVAALGENPNLSHTIWVTPVNELVQTAQSLYQQREQCKQVIYEITGVSDILRGASVASETATAQNIKNQWGTLRLKRMQKEVQRYCRDALSIILEIAAAKFDTETFIQMTGLPFFTQEKKQQLEMMGQQVAQQAQAQGQQPPQIPPEVQIAMKAPTWEEITAALKDDTVRMYKTDIETNSTLDAEAAQDKQDIAELMTALSQLLNAIGPLVEKGIMPFDIAKGMMLTISRRYNFGSQLEDALNGMTAPQPQEDEGSKADAEVAKIEAQAKIQEIQMKMQMEKEKHQMEMAKLQEEAKISQMELEIKRQELELQKQSLAAKTQAEGLKHQQRIQQIQAAALAKQSAPSKEPANATV